jgi:cell division ATPase FtsA
VRTLNTGGNAIVDQLAGELGVDLDTAEDLKRRADPMSDHPGEAQAGRVVAGSVTSLLEEVRGRSTSTSHRPTPHRSAGSC